MGRDDQTIGLPSIHKFTYNLETDEDDGMGMIRPEVSHQSTSSRTIWRQTKTMGRDDQTIGLPSIHKFTYGLETDEENGAG
jgi:hypothetical protein